MSNTISEKAEPSRKAVVCAFAVLLLFWLAVLWPLPKALFKESDSFWLIEVGRTILQKIALPTSDPYSFASLHNHWVVYQWLSEVMFAAANAFGLAGVSIFGEVTLALLLCVLLFRRMLKLGANSIVSFVVIAIVAHSTYPDVATLRPQLFSFVFLFFLQTILEDVWSGDSTRKQLRSVILKTLGLGILWANCHVSFVMGVLMSFLYLCCAACRAVFHKDEDKGRLLLFTAIAAVFLGATLINPYGFGLWIFVKELNANYVTQEMQALDWSASSLYIVVYSLFLLSTIFLWRSAALPRFVLAVVLFVIGCLHARLIIYFCLSICPLVGQAVSEMLPNITSSGIVKRLSALIEVVAFKVYYPTAIVLIATIAVVSQPLYISRSVPLKSAEFLNTHKVDGNLFCSAHAGSYLIYKFRGSIKVFMDTRVDLYAPDLCRKFIAAINGVGWKELFREYHITEALLPNAAPLTHSVEGDPDWQKIYEDEDFSILTQRSY